MTCVSCVCLNCDHPATAHTRLVCSPLPRQHGETSRGGMQASLESPHRNSVDAKFQTFTLLIALIAHKAAQREPLEHTSNTWLMLRSHHAIRARWIRKEGCTNSRLLRCGIERAQRGRATPVACAGGRTNRPPKCPAVAAIASNLTLIKCVFTICGRTSIDQQPIPAQCPRFGLDLMQARSCWQQRQHLPKYDPNAARQLQGFLAAVCPAAGRRSSLGCE